MDVVLSTGNDSEDFLQGLEQGKAIKGRKLYSILQYSLHPVGNLFGADLVVPMVPLV